MSPSRHRITYYYDNKFVLTADRSYFVPYRREFCFPPIQDIRQEIFDLNDSVVYKVVRDGLAVGRIIVGDYFAKSEEIVIQVPLKTGRYVKRRLKEVFGDV